MCRAELLTSLGRTLKFAFAVALFLSLTIFQNSLAAQGEPPSSQKIETFQGYSYNGDKFDLTPYLGKVPILLDFGSIYCTTCVQSIPHLIVLQNKYGEDKLKVVGVNLDTYGIGRVKRFYSTFSASLNFPILIDRGLKISSKFNVLTLPTYILIDKNGEIVTTIVGWDEENKVRLENVLEKVISGESVAEEEKEFKKDVVLLSPSNFTMTFQDQIWVVGLAGDSKGPFKVKLNGGSEREAVLNGGMFSTRIMLTYGSNFIEVVYPKGDGIGTQAVVLFRDPRMGEGMGVNFPEYQFHIEGREDLCLECHEIMPDQEMASMGMTMVCNDCHGYQTDQKFVHGPIPVGGCPACHDFESAPGKFELSAMGSDLCFNCHGDVQSQFEKENVHGPVVMGFCTVCHNAHGSSFKYQLRTTQSQLCVGCHEEMRDKLSKFYVHAPVARDNCTGCHDPHSSDNPQYFLKGKGEELCLLCHSQEKMAAHTHPTSGKAKFAAPEMVLTEEKHYQCKSCHDPHSSNSEKLSRVSGGCNGCHDALVEIDPPKRYDEYGREILKDEEGFDYVVDDYGDRLYFE